MTYAKTMPTAEGVALVDGKRGAEQNGAARARRDEMVEIAARSEIPNAPVCLKIARASFDLDDLADAYQWLLRAASGGNRFVDWASAAATLARFEQKAAPPARRCVRVALAGSYTTSQLVPLLRLAGLARGMHVHAYEAPFDSYTQQVLDPGSALYEFAPDYVILAPHEGAVRFPSLTKNTERALEDEVTRWTSLWRAVSSHSQARVIQHNIAIRADTAWGHAGARVPGSRAEMLRALNTRLARAAGDTVLVVDCDRIASAFGKSRWFDDRYWHLAKQAVALDALPDLARHTAAVVAAAEGLSSKCIVLDLDNTLWGGVVAEDGLAGISLGDGPDGEAYIAFQEYLLELRARGVLLAVVSKNNESDAREPFEHHPDMRLALSDIAVFIANWTDKATNLRLVASTLNIGVDSLVFVDDNPVERQLVRKLIPELCVIPLPPQPAGYARAVADSLLFESAAVTAEDMSRAEQYRARAAAAALKQQTASLEEFYTSLGMEASVARFDELNLPRIAQLVGKTNQFNLTTRRHGLQELRRFMTDDRFVTLYLRLRDRFGDHGLVAVMIASRDGKVLDIDTWLMSCRVIGRTVEHEMFRQLCQLAVERGCSIVRGTFIPTSKNAVVQDLFERLGFVLISADGGSTTWSYDITAQGLPRSDYVGVIDPRSGAVTTP